MWTHGCHSPFEGYSLIRLANFEDLKSKVKIIIKRLRAFSFSSSMIVERVYKLDELTSNMYPSNLNTIHSLIKL